MAKRRRFAAAFKAPAVLAAVREGKTVQQIAAQPGVHANQVGQ